MRNLTFFSYEIPLSSVSRCSLGNCFHHQCDCSAVQPCIFCKCYLHALVVLTHLTEFIKLSLWPVAMLMQVGKKCSDQLMEKEQSVMVNTVIERCTRGEVSN